MVTFLVFLLLFTVSIIVIPVVLTNLGLNLDPWVLNAIAAFIGSLVAIIGSIAINLITDSKRKNKAYNRELNLLKLELYNNYIICIHRITSNTRIEFNTATFKNFIQFIGSIDDTKYGSISSELQVLYFIIGKGDQLLVNYKDFCLNAFTIEHKIPKHIIDVLEIIQSKNLDNIYEFAIIKNIIQINKKYDLNIALPFNEYDKLLDNYDHSLSESQRISLYISELVCKYIFESETKIYILDKLNQGGDLVG